MVVAGIDISPLCLSLMFYLPFIAKILDEAIAQKELTATEAETIAIAILRQNALNLYH